MRHEPLTRKQLYAKLLPLKKVMQQFKDTKEVRLSSADIALMVEVYPSVQILGQGSMPLSLNGGCPSCISEAFHIFISVFDRLSNDPHVTDDEPKSDGIGKADGIHSDAGKDGANVNANPPADTVGANDTANATELDESEEATLLELLGIDKDASPQEYLTRLDAYIEGLPEPGIKLENKLAKLQAVVASLPKVKVVAVEPVIPPAVKEDNVTGTAINKDTRTPAQKAKETKAKNAAKKSGKAV